MEGEGKGAKGPEQKKPRRAPRRRQSAPTQPPPRWGLARVREAAVFLGMSTSSIYGLMDSGKLPHVKLPGKNKAAYACRIEWAELHKLVERCTVTAGKGEADA
jgi:anti-sigma factor RsiW